jgi:hypothetical protein
LIPGHPHRRASFFFVILWIFSTAPAGALAHNDDEIEYPAKLAFLYNFAKFIEWPVASYRFSGAPFVLCIAGRDPFRPDDESELRTRTVLGHPIQIRRLTGTSGVCNIAFIPLTERDQADNILRAFRGSSTLTVGEIQGFAARGGIINLTVERNRLSFEINQQAAERAGLKISSKLLGLAKIVTDDQGRP